MQPQQRLYEIDFLRFLAACAVMAFHYLFAGNRAGDMDLPIPDALEYAAQFGLLGVELFFLISGFVIAMSMQHGSAMRFLLDRLIRLYPVYLAAVLVTATVRMLWGNEATSVSLGDLLLNISMIAGIFEEQLGLEFMDGVYWTLMVELQFYFLMLLVLLSKQLKRLEPILFGWLLLTLASDHVGFPGWLDELLVLEWSPYFIAGALFYQVQTRGTSLLRIIGLATCAYLSMNYAIWHLEGFTEIYDDWLSDQITIVMISGAYILFVLLINSHLSWLRVPWMIWLGGLTYPLYLIHQEIGYILFRQLDDWGSPAELLVAVSSGMLILSLLMYLLLDRWLGSRLRGRAHAWLASRGDAGTDEKTPCGEECFQR